MTGIDEFITELMIAVHDAAKSMPTATSGAKDHRAIGRREALAFRIWAIAAPAGWNMTLGEIADVLGESINRVRGVSQHKGWHRRIRIVSPHSVDTTKQSGMLGGFDGPTSVQKGDGVGGI